MAPFNGGSPLTAYSITIRQSDGLTYSSELGNCNGSNSGVITAASCTIPISTLQASPFNLPWGASVYAKITATNIVGISDLANAGNGGTILTNPDQPTALTNIPATTSASVIAFSWTAGSLNGGSPVIEYRVNWDQGTNTYAVLDSSVTGLSYSTSATLTPNTVYKFKLESRNSYGFSTLSSEISIRAAKIPDAPQNL